MEIIAPESILRDITEEEIIKISKLSVGDFDKYKFTRRSGIGRYLKIINNNTNTYIVVSRKDKEDGRNSFILQYVKPPYIKYSFDKSKDKNFQIYVLDENVLETNYHIFVLRLLKTIGTTILNKDINEKIKPFNTISDLKIHRRSLTSTNTGNNPSYFIEGFKNIVFYGKTYGANCMESVMMCIALLKIIDNDSFEKIYFYPIKEQDTNDIDKETKQLLELNEKIEILEPLEEISNPSFKFNKIKGPRRTAEFHKNLLCKYGDKKCYLCDCNIEKIIIGAHIHRITDIKNDVSLKDIAKIKNAISENNGLWMCPLHDRLFEIGFIYFSGNKLIFNNSLTDEQINFVKNRTEGFKIHEEHWNEEMNYFINKHKARILEIETNTPTNKTNFENISADTNKINKDIFQSWDDDIQKNGHVVIKYGEWQEVGEGFKSWGEKKQKVRIVSQVNAGKALHIAEEDLLGYIFFNDFADVDTKKDYALQIDGDSMNEKKINDKLIEEDDYVLVKPDYSINSGDTIVAIDMDGAVNVKEFYKDEDGGMLKSISNNKENINVDSTGYTKLGKVVDVIKSKN